MSDIHSIYERILEIAKHNSHTDTRLEALDEKVTKQADAAGEIKTLIEQMNTRLDRISETDHAAHHTYVETLIKKQQNRERLLAVVTHELAKKGTIATIVFLLALFWAGATDSIADFLAKIKQ